MDGMENYGNFAPPADNPVMDRITAILQKRAQPIEMSSEQQMYATNAAMAYAGGNQNRGYQDVVNDWRAPQLAAQDRELESAKGAYDMFERKRQAGDKNLQAIYDQISKITSDPMAQAKLIDAMHNDPEPITPQNALMKAARYTKELGIPTDFQRTEEKRKADLAATGGGGKSPAAVLIANEIELARKEGNLQRVTDLERAQKMIKVGEGMTVGPDGVTELPGYGDVAGGIEEDKKFGAAKGEAEGKNRGEKEVLIGQMTARIPQLIDVTKRLSQAGQKATYTAKGRLWNEARLQTGYDATEEAVARTEYVSIVDNEVLPLLRETFGAQFTQKEGESLKVTLGDPNLQPSQKDAVLRSFMTSKMGTINSIARELGRPEPFTPQDIQSVLSQINISTPSVAQPVNNSGWSIRKK